MTKFLLVLPLLGACHVHHSGGVSPAVVSAEKAALGAPTESDVWASLGEAYLSEAQFEKAFSAFSEARRLDSESARAAAGLEKLANAQWISEIERKALDNPADDEIWGDIGDHFAERGQSEKALTYYLHAMSLDPTDSEWHQKLAESGSSEQVVAFYESNAVHNQDNDEWLGDYGDLLARMDRREDACSQYRNALALDPGDSEWVQRVGECDSGAPLGSSAGDGFEGHGMMEHEGGLDMENAHWSPEARVQQFEQLIAQEPENDEFWGGLAQAHIELGSLEQGGEALERALSLDPTDSTWPTIYCALTGTSLVDVLTAQLDQHAENDELHGDLGDAYVTAGNPEKAKESYLRAAELDPDDEEWRSKLRVLGE